MHWHEQHTEFFEVLQGVGKLTLENLYGALETHYVSKTSGIVEIARYKKHSLGRGDAGSSSFLPTQDVQVLGNSQPDIEEWSIDLLVREWTDPKDGKKEVFFRNLAGIIEDFTSRSWIGHWWTEWQLWVVFGALDNYPAVLGGRWRGVEWVLVHLLCLVLGVLGKAVGLKGEYSEYTPRALRRAGLKEKEKNS